MAIKLTKLPKIKTGVYVCIYIEIFGFHFMKKTRKTTSLWSEAKNIIKICGNRKSWVDKRTKSVIKQMFSDHKNKSK